MSRKEIRIPVNYDYLTPNFIAAKNSEGVNSVAKEKGIINKHMNSLGNVKNIVFYNPIMYVSKWW